MELFFVICLVLAYILYSFSITGAAFLITMASFGLMVTYILFAVPVLSRVRLKKMFKRSSYEGVSIAGVVFSMLSGIVLAFGVFSLCNLLQSWPAGEYLRVFSIILLLPLCITSGVLLITSKKSLYKHIIIRSGLLLLLNYIIVFFV